ncbi:hypothetical protein ACFX13_025344 [Malus domestica]
MRLERLGQERLRLRTSSEVEWAKFWACSSWKSSDVDRGRISGRRKPDRLRACTVNDIWLLYEANSVLRSATIVRAVTSPFDWKDEEALGSRRQAFPILLQYVPSLHPRV